MRLTIRDVKIVREYKILKRFHRYGNSITRPIAKTIIHNGIG